MNKTETDSNIPPRIRDRIKELRRVRAGDLQASPKNWRTHPKKQVDALQGALREIGYADALLTRELPDGSLELIDGHARQSLDENQIVPVLVTDLDEQEAAKVLATLDPMAAMAEADTAALERLLKEVEIADPALQAILDGLAAENGIALDDELATNPPAVPIPAVLQIVVQCESESQQEELFERLQEEGYACRVLTL
ncbi:MAG: ParB N-terminal domain-containing protein [Thermoguttaceae bacterium]